MKLFQSIILLVLLHVNSLLAQDAEDLSKEAANPLANLMSFPFQNNTNFGIGPFDRTSNFLNIQPVIPLANGKFITRTIFPIVWIPDISQESGMYSTGLGDILFTGFYTPESKGMMWGIGPAIEIPTGGEKRGTQKWSIGPSFVLLTQPGNWTLGVLLNNVWSIAGNADASNVNKGLLQYFIVYQLGDGWYVNSAPIITVNWKAESGQQWTVPFGLGGGKLFFAGKLPINVQLGAFYNAVKPDLGADWQFRTQLQFLLPTSIFGG
jgi:hypothetical protein